MRTHAWLRTSVLLMVLAASAGIWLGVGTGTFDASQAMPAETLWPTTAPQPAVAETKQDASPSSDDPEALPPNAVQTPDGNVTWIEDFSSVVGQLVTERSQRMGLPAPIPYGGSMPGVIWADDMNFFESWDLDIIQEHLEEEFARYDLFAWSMPPGRIAINVPSGRVAQVRAYCDCMRAMWQGEVTVTLVTGWCNISLWPEFRGYLANEDDASIDDFLTWAAEKSGEQLEYSAPRVIRLRCGETRAANWIESHRYVSALYSQIASGAFGIGPYITEALNGSSIIVSSMPLGDGEDIRLRTDVEASRDFETTLFACPDPDGRILQLELPRQQFVEYANEVVAAPERLILLCPGPDGQSEWVHFTAMSVREESQRATVLEGETQVPGYVARRYDVLGLSVTDMDDELYLHYPDSDVRQEWTAPEDEDDWCMYDEEVVDYLTEFILRTSNQQGEEASIRTVGAGYIEFVHTEGMHALLQAGLRQLYAMRPQPMLTDVVLMRVPRAGELPESPTLTPAASATILTDSRVHSYVDQSISLRNGEQFSIVTDYATTAAEEVSVTLPQVENRFSGRLLQLEVSRTHRPSEFLATFDGMVITNVPGENVPFYTDSSGQNPLYELPTHETHFAELSTTLTAPLGQWAHTILSDVGERETQLVLYVRVTPALVGE